MVTWESFPEDGEMRMFRQIPKTPPTGGELTPREACVGVLSPSWVGGAKNTPIPSAALSGKRCHGNNG